MGRPKNMFLRKCPICGKLFWCDNLDMWAYKHGYRSRETGKINPAHVVIFCSYGCMRRREKENGKV